MSVRPPATLRKNYTEPIFMKIICGQGKLIKFRKSSNFPQFGSYLWINWSSLKFYHKCNFEQGRRRYMEVIRIHIQTSDSDSESGPDSPWRRSALSKWRALVNLMLLFHFSGQV